MRGFSVASIVMALLLAAPESSQAASPTAGMSAAIQVPFVSCASDGQGGPQRGPKNGGRVPSVSQSVGRSLAYYASADLGVLAPRGWHCFGLYGSDGSVLIVTPEPHHAADFLGRNTGITGPVIQLSLSLGSTSGRFEVAQVAARLFPGKKAFVNRVIHEHIDPASDFPFRPYPSDSLTRRSDTDVEFKTPGNTDGMGTKGRLVKNSSPIDGVAIMTADDNLVLLEARVPPDLRNLVPTIIEQTRRASR